MTRLVHPSARHLLVMLLCSGCATARLEGHTTWEEDIEEGVVLTPTEGKLRHDPAQDLVDVEVDWAYLDRKEGRPKVVRIDPPPVEEVAAQLELSLLRFTSDMRMVGSRLRAHDRSRRRRAKRRRHAPEGQGHQGHGRRRQRDRLQRYGQRRRHHAEGRLSYRS